MRGHFLFVIGIVLALGLSGCGDNSSPMYPPPRPMPHLPPQLPQASREKSVSLNQGQREFLENFRLLDERGRPKPPGENALGISPFGVLVNLKEGLCNAVHVKRRKVVSDSHCIKPSTNPEDLYVIFFDKEGRRVYQPIESIDVLGNPLTDDILVLSVSDDVGSTWDVAGAKFFKTDDTINAKPPESHDVTVWAFDFSDEKPSNTARLKPRHCTLSRTKPETAGLSKLPNGNEGVTPFTNSFADSNLHGFLDQCDSPLVEGNSGAIITIKDNFEDKLGFILRNFGPPGDASFKMYFEFQYQGNDGMTHRMLGDELPGKKFYAWATMIESLEKKTPDWLE